MNVTAELMVSAKMTVVMVDKSPREEERSKDEREEEER